MGGVASQVEVDIVFEHNEGKCVMSTKCVILNTIIDNKHYDFNSFSK